MTNAERKAMLFEAELTGRDLYDDERIELRKLLRSRSITTFEREHLIELFPSKQLNRLPRLPAVGFRLNGGLILLSVFALVVGFVFYQRYETHLARAASLQSVISLDQQYEQRFSALSDRLSPVIDAFNHADDMVRDMQWADFATADQKLQHLAYEQSRIDRLMADLKATVQSMHEAFRTPEKREVN
jgi:hypothetical protein